MIVFLGIISAIALLALIVYALHKFQQIEKEESVDRNSPLPPLPSHQVLDDSPANPMPAHAERDWQQLAKELKENGQLRQALEVCESAFPQMGAFKQACVLLRAEIREAKRAGKSIEQCLAQLYKVCAMAALFHDRNPGTPVIPSSALKNIRYADFANLPMPYKDLGYAHLKLLTSTDRKMLEAIWGEPDTHQHAREFHKDAWLRIMSKYPK